MQTKINLAYYSVKDKIEDIYENGINVEEMENYFKNAFTQTIYWDKSSIYCTCGEELFIFDVEKNKYNYNTNHLPHNTINILPYYTNITEVTKRNDTYIVKVNNVWSSVTETYGYTLNGYPTYKDALNNTNELFNLTDYDDTINDYNYYAIKEIEDNYDTYKDKLKTYTYTFMKKDNNYYLTSFK